MKILQKLKRKKSTKKKSTALTETTKKPKNLPAVQDINSLIVVALKDKAGTDQLKEILKMKYEAEARESERLFHINFCKMQAEFPVIPKTKTVNTKAKVKMYSYAPLSTIIPLIKNILADHGFTYRWTKEFPEDRKMKINFHLTGYGHTETCSMILPIMPKNDFVNDIQQSGSTSTYGERYTLCGMLGIVSDEDDDGRGSENKPIPQKVKNVTPDPEKEGPPKPTVRETLQDRINVLCLKLGCKTIKDAQEKTGVKSLDDTELELLQEIKTRLEKELKEKDKEKTNAK